MSQKLPNLDLPHRIYLFHFQLQPIDLLFISLLLFLYLLKLFEILKSSVFFHLCKSLISFFKKNKKLSKLFFYKLKFYSFIKNTNKK
jgi:hypothetical protein